MHWDTLRELLPEGMFYKATAHVSWLGLKQAGQKPEVNSYCVYSIVLSSKTCIHGEKSENKYTLIPKAIALDDVNRDEIFFPSLTQLRVFHISFSECNYCNLYNG